MLNITPTPLSGVLLLTPKRFGDDRGFFCESWNKARLSEAGIDLEFVQDNHSLSAQKGTVRGLHFQAPPHAQDKLVRCGRGALFDVAVDIRQGSPTYGQWVGYELSFDNGQQLLIPAGFLHGFVTLTDDCEICYKCSDYYDQDSDGAVLWNDPDIAIPWPLTTDPILSDKDKTAPKLAKFNSPFVWENTP